jgi:hypothetical protein
VSSSSDADLPLQSARIQGAKLFILCLMESTLSYISRRRRTESQPAASDIPACGDSKSAPDRPTPLAQPDPQHRTPELLATRHARRISFPTSREVRLI